DRWSGCITGQRRNFGETLMAYFPADMPGVEPNMDDAGFWEKCGEQQLSFQACGQCGHLRHPPTPICANCHSTEIKWVQAPSKGEVFTYTVVHHASHAAVKTKLPYVVALITF